MDASELFNICTELAAAPPGDKATRRLHEVVVLCAAEGCRQQGGAFGNLFSQIDFLGKHLHLSATLVRDIQTARRHTNTGTAIDTADWPYDLAAVTRFVAAVFHCDVPGTLLRLLPAEPGAALLVCRRLRIQRRRRYVLRGSHRGLCF